MRYGKLTAALLAAGMTLAGLTSALTAKASTSDRSWLMPLLQQSYVGWKNNFIRSNGMVYANYWSQQRPNSAITEGQSYGMLKALYMNDRTTFDNLWNFTRKYMQVRPSDKLLAWWVAQNSSGGYSPVNLNYAVDGDEDIAYALMIAGESWGRPDYIEAGKAIARDLWRLTVININGRFYMDGGPWARNQWLVSVNPSYIAPYIYKKFAQYDTANAAGWDSLARTSMQTITECSNLSPVKLPGDWCGIERSTGRAIFPFTQQESARNYSYEAYRVFWRVGMEAALGSRYSQYAPPYMTDASRQTPITYMTTKGQMPDGWDWKGNPMFPSWNTDVLSGKSAPGPVSAAIAQNNYIRPWKNKEMYDKYLAPALKQGAFWGSPNDYYTNSVIWLNLYTVNFGSPMWTQYLAEKQATASATTATK